MEKFYRNLILGLLVLVTIALVAILVPFGTQRGIAPISSPERAQQLASEGKREQIVTISDGMIPLPERAAEGLTPPARLFAIPVGQITLAEPERLSSSGSPSGSSRGYGGVGWQGFRERVSADDDWPVLIGAFNNIMIYDKGDGSLQKIFDKRIAVSAMKFVSRTTPRVLVITGTSTDSDRDGAVDSRDIQQLYVYGIENGKLHEVRGLEGSAGTAINVQDVDYLIVGTTLDTDRDGSTQGRAYVGGAGPEPQRLYRIDLRTFAATPLMDQKLVNELQTTLDGLQPAAQAPK